MKSRSAKLLCAVLCITGILLLTLGMPAPGFGEALGDGIVTANVNLRKAPTLRGGIISGLLQGARVKIYEEKSGWYRVSTKKYHQVFNGWVSIDYVKIALVEPADTPPANQKPEPEHRAQLQPSAAGHDQPAPIAVPEKPLPKRVEASTPPEAKKSVVSPRPQPSTEGHAQPASLAAPEKPLPKPVENATPPATKAPDVLPKPEPVKPAAAKPPKAKRADTQTDRPPRVKKTPLPDAGTEPEDDLMDLLPNVLPVLGVIGLLIVFLVYRRRRASRPKAGMPDLQAKPRPVVWPPPAPEDIPAVEESPVAEENQALEESEPLEADLPEDFEFQMESLPGDQPPDDAVDSPSEVAAMSAAGGVPPEDVPATDTGGGPPKAVSVYDQVMAKINRMSDVELTELLDRVDDQLGAASRQDDRLIFYTTVDYVVEDQYYRDFIQDLSVSGVFIRARQMFEPGQSVRMTFMSPFLQKPFKISGKIVRTLDTGIGVQFDRESQVQAEAISSLMDQIRKVAESG